MARRMIQLRWHGRCCSCRIELPAHERAQWDDVAHEITCRACLGQTALTSELERDRVQALIADARAALTAHRAAG